MYYISVALILMELFRFEFYNKNLTLFTPISTLFRPYFDPRGSRTRPFRPWGFNFGFMYNLEVSLFFFNETLLTFLYITFVSFKPFCMKYRASQKVVVKTTSYLLF